MQVKDIPIVKDPTKNEQLLSQGYFQFQLLSKEEVEALRAVYNTYHQKEKIEGLYVSSNVKPWDELMEISDKISAVVSNKLDVHFQNVQKIGGTFIVKNQDKENVLQAHQDWRIVDEDQYRSYTVWIALQDTNDNNGAMYVLPTSHNWIRGFRHITIPSVYGKVYDLTWKYMQPIHLKAGEAIIFDHALAHASKANQSSTLRIAATTTILSKEATMRICCNNDDVVEEYECPPGFYIKPEARVGPFKLPKIRNTAFKMVQLTESSFLAYAKANNLRPISKRSSFLERISALFNKSRKS